MQHHPPTPPHRGDVALRCAEAVAAEQDGALTRAQALEAGLTRERIRTLIRGRRWQRPLAGVYVTFTGPLPEMTRLSVALLHAGPGAALSHESAAWLHRALDFLPPVVSVVVPWGRKVARVPGLRVRRSRQLPGAVHPVRRPRQVRVEETLLDLVEASDESERVVGWLTAYCQRRLTTAAKVRAAAARRPRMRWRALVADVLEDIVDGVHSALERRWRRDVEIRHGLPRGLRNRAEVARRGRRYRDVRYRRWKVVVELDGRAAHPDDLAHRDRRRDNAAALDGEASLRYGWPEVAGAACECAAELERLLRLRGWPGRGRPCGRGCPVGR